MDRFGFVLKRLALTLPLLAGIVLVVFLLLEVTPGDPARQIVGLRASQDELNRVRDDLGLNDPLPTRYALRRSGSAWRSRPRTRRENLSVRWSAGVRGDALAAQHSIIARAGHRSAREIRCARHADSSITSPGLSEQLDSRCRRSGSA